MKQNMITKLLKILYILQEQEHKNPYKAAYVKTKLNPYNPLTYLTILIFVAVGIVMYGIVGVWTKIDVGNPFKWQ